MSMPARLGRYAVRRRIGSGAFATVWLAYDEQLDSPVAIKVLADNWTEDHHVRQRFLEEGRYLRKVESPHVVSVYDAGELEDGRPYLVMAYADQGTLADRLEIDGLTPQQAMEVVRQVGAGLHALHQRGILHRDVKPANVLFRTVDGEVRAMVGDLGLGKALDMSSRLTMIAGTPSFVAPEQALGESLDARADQYSLAALAYLLLTGRAPYAHASLAAAADPGPAPSLSTPQRPFPTAVDDVVRRGLASRREDRWPDVTVFVSALTGSLGDDAAPVVSEPWLPLDPQLTQPGAAPSARPASGELGAPTPPRRTGRRVLAAAVGLPVVAAAVVAGYVAAGPATEDRTFDDASGSLTATVPASWGRSVSDEGWRPPRQSADYPSLSVGSGSDWTEAPAGEGVFLGILPGTELPAQVPQHPECGGAQDPVDATSEGDSSVTVFYTDCPAGITVERVVQITQNRLLWVQVRSSDSATANRVLDGVETHGFR